GLEGSKGPVELRIASPRPIPLPASDRVRVQRVGTASAADWRRAWRWADLVIVTGTRTLLEAIQGRVPFLYFNGVLGRGRSARRHRPEKLDGWLSRARAIEIDEARRRDLSDFARLRRVEPIVRAAATARVEDGPAPIAGIARGFPAPFGNGLRLVQRVVARFGAGTDAAPDLVRAVRRESRRRPGRVEVALSKV
ncbi:MAG: hypothetical protein L3J91_01420, partial [Thermoplasmata archaeon]|nr:hypothetical protein [Thermoplasmata archaeon]